MRASRPNKRKSRGWVPFGYKYLGPGNDLYRGKPTTEGDKAAQRHDWEYEFLEQRNVRPKLVYSEADDQFIKDVGTKHYSEWIAQNIFKAKKRLAEAGWLEDIRPLQKSKRETSRNDWKQFVTPEQAKFNLGFNVSPDKKTKAKRNIFENSSLTNRPPSEQSIQSGMSESKAKATSQSTAGATETPVDKVNPYKVFRGPPNYTFASLPYQYDAVVNDSNTYCRDHVFRMTSPYDPLNNIQRVDQNINATGTMNTFVAKTDLTDTNAVSANWWTYYSGLYKYYHTISAEYSIFIENYGEPLWVYFMHMNEDIPPTLATNKDMQLWNDCEYHYVNALSYGVDDTFVRVQGFIGKQDDVDDPMENNKANAQAGGTPAETTSFVTTNNVQTRSGSTVLRKYGNYKTGDFDNEIRLDADIETWTEVMKNPKLPEKLIIRVKPQSDLVEKNNPRSAGDDLKYRIRVQINYLVEFKELDIKIRYPVLEQPLSVTLSDTVVGRS